MKDKILLGVLLAIVAVGTVAGIYSFVHDSDAPTAVAFGLMLGAFFTFFTPIFGLMWKYLFNGVLLHFPILNVFVILRAFVTFIIWLLALTLIGKFLDESVMGIILKALIIIAHIAFRIYRIKNPDVVVNGEEV